MAKIKYFSELTLDIVKDNLVQTFKDNGYDVKITENYPGCINIRVTQDGVGRSVMFHTNYNPHFEYGETNRKLKNMENIYEKMTIDIQKDVRESDQRKAEAQKQESVMRMFEVFGYTEDNSRIYTYKDHCTFKTPLSNLVQNVKIEEYSYYSKDYVDMKLMNDGTSTFTVQLQDIDLDKVSVMKAEIEKIQSAWELSVL